MKTDRLPFWVLDILIAGALLSRLPLPHLPERAFAHSARAVWAYPLVGAVLGALAGACGLAMLALGLPPVFAAGGVLAVLMLLTGAMHEDGLADTADGFWGGYDPARRLEIMKDSHIGTYGVLSLLVVCGLRWLAYAALLPQGLGAIIAVAALSRAMMPCVMACLRPARTVGLSQSVGVPGMSGALISLAVALLIAGGGIGIAALPGVVLCAVVALLLGGLAKSKINGQTGDVLGATQQLCETALLALLVILVA